ncbi:MAG: hypothetical protein KIT02_04040 [Devosia sp.]|uniref:hypothetical protein n=1 Tax=Devosia sp. TaxID=1871048 RepID=UPI0024C7AAE9|nr:hypothetical protein [Devosia sp.]UYO00398.1 MAG: hypothetical protein KIT02_04040 [Devosia sp.]
MSAQAELAAKLQIKPGSRVWLVNAPSGIAGQLSASAGLEIVDDPEAPDAILCFFTGASEVKDLVPRLLSNLPADGLLWVAYRKGPAAKAAGLNRDAGWEPLEAAGWRPVRQIAVDDEWSALRFRPREMVKAREGSRFA